MKKLFLLLFLFPLSALADATAIFSVVAPTHYVNEEPIQSDDPLSYYLYCGSVQGSYNIALNVTSDIANGGEEIDVSLCVPSPGTYYFVATAYSFLYKTESDYSNEQNRVFVTGDFYHLPLAPKIVYIVQ